MEASFLMGTVVSCHRLELGFVVVEVALRDFVEDESGVGGDVFGVVR
jgi:hypothetical protein